MKEQPKSREVIERLKYSLQIMTDRYGHLGASKENLEFAENLERGCGDDTVTTEDEYSQWGAKNPLINKFLFDNHNHTTERIVYDEVTILCVIDMVREENNWQLDPNTEGSFAFNAMNRIDLLETALKNLIDATEDKDGQFSNWHKHLRAMTKAAKNLIA